MKLLRILLLFLIPATAFCELPVLEPTLVEGEYNVIRKSNSVNYNELTQNYLLVDKASEGSFYLSYYNPQLKQIKRIKEFDSTIYDDLNILDTDLDVELIRAHNTITKNLEIWSSDFTESGTFKLDSINMIKSLGSLFLRENAGFKQSGDNVFIFNEIDSNTNLWVTDGQEKNTKSVNTIKVPSNIFIDRFGSTDKGVLYQTLDTSKNIFSVWSNDLSDNTYLYKSLPNEYLNFYDFNNNCFIYPRLNKDSIYNRPLVITDGTKKGTIDLLNGKSKYLKYEPLINNDESMVFRAIAKDYYTIYVTDGTKDGTLEIATVENEYNIIFFEEQLKNQFFYFLSESNELYITNRANEPTEIIGIEDLTYVREIKVFDDNIYIIADLFQPDGTETKKQGVWKYDIEKNTIKEIFIKEGLYGNINILGDVNDRILVNTTYKERVGTKTPTYSELWLCDNVNNRNELVDIFDEKTYHYNFQKVFGNNNIILFSGYSVSNTKTDLYIMDKNFNIRNVKPHDAVNLAPFPKDFDQIFTIADNYISFIANYYGNSNKLYTLDRDLVISSVAQSHENKITTYPNPVTNFLTIEGIENENVSIFNLEGELISQEQLNGNAIDVSKLSAGFYFIVDSNGEFMTKFVKE